MDFPDGQPVGKRERSIAERHRMLILLWSIAILLPVGYMLSFVVASPPLRLLSTLVVSFAATWALTKLLRRRFMGVMLSEELILRPTLRAPGRRTSEAVQELSGQGFACLETVVLSTPAGITLTRPIVVMQRPGDGQVAHANSLGSCAITSLNDGTWLLTSTSLAVAHPSLRFEQVPMHQTTVMLDQHRNALIALRVDGVEPSVQPPPLDLVLGIERMEQETIAAFRASGVVAPSARALVEAYD